MITFFKRSRRYSKGDLRRMLNDFRLPSFPTTASRLLSMLRSEEASSAEITEVLLLDPGLHVKILGSVNSAVYGLSTRVNTVQQAVTLLGRSRVEALVLSVAVQHVVPKTADGGFDARGFWLAAARRGTVAQALGQLLHPRTAAESFAAGFLQDVAVPVLAAEKQEDYCTVYDRWKTDPATRLDVLERETFGYDHQLVGAAIAEEWGLPEYLVRAIGHHHDSDSKVEPAVRLTALLRDGTEPGTDALVASCEEWFGIEATVAAETVTTAFDHAKGVSDALK